jgi:hypothetical protein
MRRLISILRCQCRRCAAWRRRVLTALAICLAIAGNWKILRADHQSILGRGEGLTGAGKTDSSAGFYDYSAADRSPAPGKLDSWVLNSNAHVRKPALSPERFNAALAAGLIDPSRIRILDPIIPNPSSPAEHPTSLTVSGMGTEHPADRTNSGGPLVIIPEASQTLAPATKPTRPSEAMSTLAPAADRSLPTVPVRSTQAETNGGVFAPDRSETLRKDPTLSKKLLSGRFVAKVGPRIPEAPSAQRSMSRNDVPPNGTDDHDLRSHQLTENLQRFALDFVRADQTDDVAEQERFFADSVHFYREGDLSLAGVAAATRRYHREQQARRSEAAGPAIAKGPVNGGFFVIEQPVRWTQSQGSKVLKGRSVLRLRVVPIDHGGWKITSIDEANN